MYMNLKAEMVRRHITQGMLAETIGICQGTFSQKMQGKSDFTVSEAKNIKQALGTSLPLERLFEEDE